jgi:peptide/nickel transport system substrate-binding protein
MTSPRKYRFLSIMILVVLALTLASCTTPEPEQVIITQIVEGETVIITATSPPAQDKVLNWQNVEPTMGLDPAQAGTSASITLINFIHDGLIGYDEDNNPIMWLAESFEPNADASEWTLTLRPNAKFSDGSDVTTADVEFSVNHYLEYDLMQAIYSYVDGMEIIDEKTMTFTLVRPIPEFLSLHPMFILSKTACEAGCEFLEVGIPTSGPWYLEEYVPKSHAKLRKNPYYWLEGYPKFDVVDYVFQEDMTAQVAAVEAGERDKAYLPPKDAARFEGNPDVNIMVLNNLGQYVGYGFDKTVPPFSDKRVRQAVGLMLEPQQRADACWFGIANPLYGGYVYGQDAQWFGDLGLEPWRKSAEARTAEAQALLTDAGWEDLDGDGVLESHGVEGIADGTVFEVTANYESNWPQSECHTLLLQEWVARVGIDLTPNAYDPSAYWTDVVDSKMQMWHIGIGGSLFPWERLRILFHSEGAYNPYSAHVSDPDLDVLIDAMLAEPDIDKKMPLMQAVHEYIVDQQYFVSDGSQNAAVLVNSELINFYVTPEYLMHVRALITADIPGR